MYLKDWIIQVYGLYIYYGLLLCFLCCLLFLSGCCYGFRYGMNDVMMLVSLNLYLRNDCFKIYGR